MVRIRTISLDIWRIYFLHITITALKKTLRLFFKLVINEFNLESGQCVIFLNWFMTFVSFLFTYGSLWFAVCLLFVYTWFFFLYVFLTRLATGLNEENPKEGRRTKTQQLRCGALLLNRYHLRFEFQLLHSNLINIKLMHVLMNLESMNL